MTSASQVSGTDAELIVYLEPHADSKLAQGVDSFLKDAGHRFLHNTASRYDCHCSMTGFFHYPDATDVADVLNSCLPQTGLGRVEVKQALIAKETPHLLLPVQAPRAYHKVVELFAHKMWTQFHTQVRPKRIDHISLAYYDEPQGREDWNKVVESGLLIDMKELAMTTIEISQQTNWDIVLLRRTCKGAGQGQKHKFKLIRRWNNVDRMQK